MKTYDIVAHPLCRKINYIIILWASITKRNYFASKCIRVSAI